MGWSGLSMEPKPPHVGPEAPSGLGERGSPDLDGALRPPGPCLAVRLPSSRFKSTITLV